MPRTSGDHQGHDGAQHEENSANVRIKYLVPGFRIKFVQQGIGSADSRVVNENVNPAIAVAKVRRQASDAAKVRDVASDSFALYIVVGEFACRRLHAFGAPTSDNDAGSQVAK